MKDCLAFLFIRFLFSRRYFGFEVFKDLLHGQCVWVVLLGKVSFGNSTSRILFSPSGWQVRSAWTRFRASSQTTKDGRAKLFISGRLNEGSWLKAPLSCGSSDRVHRSNSRSWKIPRSLDCAFFFFLFVTLLQQNSFHLNSSRCKILKSSLQHCSKRKKRRKERKEYRNYLGKRWNVKQLGNICSFFFQVQVKQ